MTEVNKFDGHSEGGWNIDGAAEPQKGDWLKKQLRLACLNSKMISN